MASTKKQSKSENKTQATGASVAEYLASRGSEEQIADCRALMSLFAKITGKKPKMWGPSIVGYGLYRYTYDSGRSGEMPLVGFAIRGRDLVIYLSVDGPAQQALLSRVGRHKMGKSCFYFKRLADLDRPVLERLVVGSIGEVEEKYG
jgi:hypothetical protein